NPVSKQQFIALVETYISHYELNANNECILHYIWSFTTQLDAVFSRIKDKNAVLSLCLNFNDPEKEECQPENLLELIQLIEGVESENTRLILIKIATSLINIEGAYSYGKFRELVKEINQDDTGILPAFLALVYEKPPYPDLVTTLGWYKKAKKEY